MTVPDGAGPLPHLLVHGYVEDREFARGGGGSNPKVRPVERRAHGERVKSEADTALATQDARRESLVELESLGVVITIEGATGFRLKLDSLEQRTTHTQPRLADRCRPAPAPTQTGVWRVRGGLVMGEAADLGFCGVGYRLGRDL